MHFSFIYGVLRGPENVRERAVIINTYNVIVIKIDICGTQYKKNI